MLQLPADLLTVDNPHRQIKLDDCTIVESCLYQSEQADAALLAQHEIIYVLNGSIRVSIGGHKVAIAQNEAILLKKGTYFNFLKKASLENTKYESILFFIQDQFIADFFAHYSIYISEVAPDALPFYKISQNSLLDAFMISLVPYFDSSLSGNKDFIRLKTFELLFNLAESNMALLKNLVGLHHHPSHDLVSIMENNYLKNLSLPQYAALSNRSLSTFKRDFERIFRTSPHKWILEKRLSTAFQLLKNGVKKPGDVYLELGFEDFSHFSKAFKKQFGLRPSEVKPLAK